MGYANYEEILKEETLKLMVLPTMKITVCLKDYLPIIFEKARIT